MWSNKETFFKFVDLFLENLTEVYEIKSYCIFKSPLLNICETLKIQKIIHSKMLKF
jgi:hypothetical protein